MTRRRKKSHFLLWIVVGISVFAMAGFGVNSAMQSTPSSPVIRVGESEISQEEYFTVLQGRLAEISQQQGQPLGMSEARLMGIPDQVRAQLVNQATLAEIARRNNLIASDEAVGKTLLEIPAFQDASGAFSRQNLDIFLKNRGLTEDEFLAQIRSDLERSMVLEILAAQPLKIDHLSGLIVDNYGERRVVSYVSLANLLPAEIRAISDEEIRGRYDVDPTRYLGAPKRRFELAYLLPDENAVSDEAVKAYYESNQAEFGTPARVNYQVMAFPSEAAARTFYDNPDFSGLAKERGLDAEDYQIEGQILLALPDDLQALIEQNGIGLYEPQKTLLGWNVYKVQDIGEADVAPLAEVRGEIVAQLASEKLNEQLTAQYEELATLDDNGARPEAVAEQSDLQFVIWQSDEAPIVGLTDSEAFNEWAANAEEGAVSELVKLKNGGVFVAVLAENPPAEPLPFEAVKEQIANEISAELHRQVHASFAEDFVASGRALESIADEQFPIVTSEPVTSQQAHNELPLAISFEAFGKPAGEVWVASDDNEFYLARVDEVLDVDLNSPQGQSIARSVQEQIDGATTEGMVLDFLKASAEEYGAVQYDALIDQVEAQIR